MREIIFDTETTGLDPIAGHRLVEIGCVEIVNSKKTGRVFHSYVNPKRDVPYDAFRIHGISTEFLKDKPEFHQIADDFLGFIKDARLVIHNAKFDMKFINFELLNCDRNPISFEIVTDTLEMARKQFPGSKASLDALCRRFKIDLSQRDKHGALLDAELLAEVYFNLTGGSQSALRFDQNKVVEEEVYHSKRKEVDFPYRVFNISKEEEEEHSKMLEKIEDSFWNN